MGVGLSMFYLACMLYDEAYFGPAQCGVSDPGFHVPLDVQI